MDKRTESERISVCGDATGLGLVTSVATKLADGCLCFLSRRAEGDDQKDKTVSRPNNQGRESHGSVRRQCRIDMKQDRQGGRDDGQAARAGPLLPPGNAGRDEQQAYDYSGEANEEWLHLSVQNAPNDKLLYRAEAD